MGVESATVITSLISTVGFPIVMCGALFWKMNRDETNRKEENAKLTEAINNNTIAITQMVDRLNMK